MKLTEKRKQSLERKWKDIVEYTQDGLILSKQVYKLLGYKSYNNFVSYIIKPLVELGYLERLGQGVYRVKRWI